MMLSLSILAPVMGAFILALYPSSPLKENEKRPRPGLFMITFFSSLISLLASLKTAIDRNSMLGILKPKEVWFQEMSSWLQWSFQLDGLNLSLYLLTTFLFPLSIYFSYNSFKTDLEQGQSPQREKLFWISLLILESSVIGVFLASNLLAFYIFWELMLIPMVLLIGIWGGKNRRYATIKFFIYTFGGSVFLILGIIVLAVYLHGVTGKEAVSFEFGSILTQNVSKLDIHLRRFIFWAFILSFLIKIPAFPFHTWLPHAHTEAPTVGSIILAGVLLKMGAYGIFRFSLGWFPQISQETSNLFSIIGVVGILYGAWLAWSQTDIKKLVAYSSVSHMGYIILGMFCNNQEGLSGAYIQMINHGISTGLLFLLVGIIYDKTHTREIGDYKGLAKISPLFAFFFMLATLSSIGFPGTNGFVGEFLVLMGAYLKNPWIASFAVLGVIFGAVYMLHLYKEVFWGEPSEKLLEIHQKRDLSLRYRDVFVIIPFIIMIFWLGVKPGLVLDSVEKSLANLIYIESEKGIAELEPDIKEFP